MVSYSALGTAIDSLEIEMSQLAAAIIELPEEELSVGSTWNTNKTQNANGIEITAKMTYTVTAISKKSVDVSFSGTAEGNNDVSGTYNGTASIDPQTGIIIQSATKSNISMTMNEQGMSLPVNMVGNTTVEVK